MYGSCCCCFFSQSGHKALNLCWQFLKRVWCTLSFIGLTVTPETPVLLKGSKVKWIGVTCLPGSAAEDGGLLWSAVLCHTHVCSEYHWVLCSEKKQNKKNTAVYEKLLMSSLLFSTAVKYKQGAAQQRCFTSSHHRFFLILLCFYLVFNSQRMHSWQTSCIYRRLCFMLGYVDS